MDKKILDTGIKAAEAAMKVLRQGFGKEVQATEKNSGITMDIVTQYDIAAQKAILKVLTAAFPDHQILTEEGVNIQSKSPYRWIIDPLDGTSNFSRGLPHFATSIGLTYKDKPVLGVIGLPATNELFYAASGMGAFRNNKQIKVTKESKFPKSLVTMSMTRSTAAAKLGYKTLGKIINAPFKTRVYGSIAVDLARVAQGALEATVFNHMNPWDIAAGVVLVREAGGQVSSTDGKPFSLSAVQMVASNKALHKKLLAVVKK